MVKRRSGADIQQEVYFRLAFYNYERFPKLKPVRLREIDEWLAADPKSCYAKRLTSRDGWVTIDHVEDDPCPYGSPESHRHRYLRRDPHRLVEHKTFSYVVRKPGKKNRVTYTYPVFRLKRDARTRNLLRRLMLNWPAFWQSDYYQDTWTAEAARMDRARMHVWACLRDKSRFDSYSDNDRTQLELLLKHLGMVREEIEREMMNARRITAAEREQRIIDPRRKGTWTQLSEASSGTRVSGSKSHKSNLEGGLLGDGGPGLITEPE